MSNSVRDKGVEMFNAVYCGDLPQPPPKGEDRFLDYMLETLFGQLWADATLSIKERRLILFGAIAAQGEEMTFAIQARAALKRGELDQKELDGVVTFLTQYVGYPKAAKMRIALMRVFQEFEETDAG